MILNTSWHAEVLLKDVISATRKIREEVQNEFGDSYKCFGGYEPDCSRERNPVCKVCRELYDGTH